jgi:hypothetical protein
MQNHASQGNQGLDKRLSGRVCSFFLNQSRNAPEIASHGRSRARNFIFVLPQVLFVIGLFSLYAGNSTPDVNESHYLTKAKHFWDSSFGAGDLFLESGNAHWFFYETIGALTLWLDLPRAAWMGRFLGWGVLAFGWCRFAKCFAANRWYAGPVTAPLWIAAMHWGHLSGEWVIGGCESKVFAYGFAFLGLSQVLSGHWKRSWLWFGISTAFHVLTGGWITLACLCSYAFLRSSCKVPQPESLRMQVLPLFVGGTIALLGVLPVLLLNRGVETSVLEKGYTIYVFQRLSHHLSPMHFAIERWWHFGILLVSSLLLWGVGKAQGLLPSRSTDNQDGAFAFSIFGSITLVIATIAFCGWLIDFLLSSWATNWSASLLRFYWFRWNDIVWPSLLSITALAILEGSYSKVHRCQLGLKIVALVLLVIPGVLLIASRVEERNRAELTPADRATLVLRHESPAQQAQVAANWIDACHWIRSNTPKDALVLTPRFQQTFKWYAHRAEIASWKDAPQDVLGLLEWERRMLEIYPRSPEGYGIEMSDEHLFAMYRKYRMNYVVLDRRIQKKPPLLPIVYSNPTYAIFDLSELAPQQE